MTEQPVAYPEGVEWVAANTELEQAVESLNGQTIRFTGLPGEDPEITVRVTKAWVEDGRVVATTEPIHD